jgi:hypothetical protein
MRTLRLAAALLLILLGLYVLLEDVHAILRYGCDINDVAAIDPRWGPVDWPTGERPTYAMVPAFVYALGFWVAGALLFVPWPEGRRRYPGRILRGTE